MTPPRQADPDKATINATVPAATKAAVAARAAVEDRIESAIVRRALDVYLVMPLAESEKAVAEARGLEGSLPAGLAIEPEG